MASCAEYQNKVQIKKDEKEYYSSTGFTLIYNDALFEQRVIKKKMNNDKIQVMHAFLKVNTPIKIMNPTNSKLMPENRYHISPPEMIPLRLIASHFFNIEIPLDLSLGSP